MMLPSPEALLNPERKDCLMKRHKYLLMTAGLLISVSAALYFLHFLIFQDAHHIFLYLLGDIAFVPIEVLLVVVVIERLLSSREKQIIMEKLNMVIGAFFSEVGTRLLGDLTAGVADRQELSRQLAPKMKWGKGDFAAAGKYAGNFREKLNPEALDLVGLRDLLADKRDFLLRLLENPNLLEHESFTDLLWAIFHLEEELCARESLLNLPPKDREHLAGDLTRVYSRLAKQWIAYARHLQTNYAFLYSLLVRTHPLQDKPSPIVE
jgi:hypothetical protein